MTLVLEDIVSETEVSFHLVSSSFAGWRPEVVGSRVVEYTVPEARLVNGIPFMPAMFTCRGEFAGDVNTYTATGGFPAANTVNTQSVARWLPEGFSTPSWSPSAQPVALLEPVEPLAVFVRSFERLAQTETFDSAARTETWATLDEETVDATTPFWTPYGAGDPRLLPSYAYWRGTAYAANQAVAMDGSEALNLQWTPDRIPSQMSMLVVLVPRAPLGDRYTVLTAIPPTVQGTGIEVVLNADSTVSLLVQDQEARTVQLSGRARPNEPIVIGLSVTFGPDANDVLMSVVDSDVRTVAIEYSGALAYSDTSWYLNHSLDARMELLEANLYTNVASQEAMIRLGMLFNRIYGVTLR